MSNNISEFGKMEVCVVRKNKEIHEFELYFTNNKMRRMLKYILDKSNNIHGPVGYKVVLLLRKKKDSNYAIHVAALKESRTLIETSPIEDYEVRNVNGFLIMHKIPEL